MKILLKIVLFPITLVLSILILFLRLIHMASSVVLNTISFFLLLATAATWILKIMGSDMFQQYTFSGTILPMLILSFLCSPFGLPFVAGFLIEVLDAANGVIKRI